MVAAWLVERTGGKLAPAAYLASAGVITFIAALLLPRAARHRMTQEFKFTRLR